MYATSSRETSSNTQSQLSQLNHAVNSNNFDSVRSAIAQGARPDSMTLSLAFRTKNIGIIDAVYHTAGAHPDEETMSMAVDTGIPELVRKAFSFGAKPNAKSFELASKIQNSEIFTALAQGFSTPSSFQSSGTSASSKPVKLKPFGEEESKLRYAHRPHEARQTPFVNSVEEDDHLDAEAIIFMKKLTKLLENHKENDLLPNTEAVKQFIQEWSPKMIPYMYKSVEHMQQDIEIMYHERTKTAAQKRTETRFNEDLHRLLKNNDCGRRLDPRSGVLQQFIQQWSPIMVPNIFKSVQVLEHAIRLQTEIVQIRASGGLRPFEGED